MTDSPRKGPTIHAASVARRTCTTARTSAPSPSYRPCGGTPPSPSVTVCKAADVLLKLKAKGIYSDLVEPEPAYTIVIPEQRWPAMMQ